MKPPSVTVVTGANSGIGLDASHRLALQGGTVVLMCRSEARGQVALEAIRAESGNRAVHLVTADLTSFDEVRAAGAHIASSWPILTALVNNAGQASPKRQVTSDGFETTMQVNHLSHFLLTHLLLDNLREGGGRVVNVTSEAHRRAKLTPAELTAVLRGSSPYKPLQAYCDSKMANVLFTLELARREEGTGVTCNALHPGVLSTAIWDRAGGWKYWVAQFFKLFMEKPEVGGRALARLASHAELAGVTGRYFHRLEPMEPRKQAQDQELSRELWNLSAEAVGLAEAS